MPLLPDAPMLASLSMRGPFLMGCLQHMKVGGGGEGSDPRDQVSAEYAQRIQQSCRCFDLDQREEVGQCAEESPPMPAALASALEAALATFESKATKIAAAHQRELDFENGALRNADPEEHEPLPPLEEAGSYDRPLTFRPPRSASRRELERPHPVYGSASRPPAAAIVAGVVRGKAELPYTPASEDAVPPPPTALGRLTEEQAEKRRDRATRSMAAHLKAATRWHTEETRLLGAARAEIAAQLRDVLSPPEDTADTSKKKAADKPDFKDEVRRGLLGPTPWLRRAE